MVSVCTITIPGDGKIGAWMDQITQVNLIDFSLQLDIKPSQMAVNERGVPYMINDHKEPIRIILLDSCNLVRAGIRSLIEEQMDLKIVADIENPDHVANQVSNIESDIILYEYDPERGCTLEHLENVVKVCKQSRIILVTRVKDHNLHIQAVKLGIKGIVSKDQSPEILFKAIRKVHSGEVWFDRTLMASIVATTLRKESAQRNDPDLQRIALLVPRELEIIRSIGLGMKNKQIADELCISASTVRHYLTSIYRKLGVTDRLELLVFAHNHKLV